MLGKRALEILAGLNKFQSASKTGIRIENYRNRPF